MNDIPVHPAAPVAPSDLEQFIKTLTFAENNRYCVAKQDSPEAANVELALIAYERSRRSTCRKPDIFRTVCSLVRQNGDAIAALAERRAEEVRAGNRNARLG